MIAEGFPVCANQRMSIYIYISSEKHKGGVAKKAKATVVCTPFIPEPSAVEVTSSLNLSYVYI